MSNPIAARSVLRKFRNDCQAGNSGWNKFGDTFSPLAHALVAEYYFADDEPLSDVAPELDTVAFRMFQLSELES